MSGNIWRGMATVALIGLVFGCGGTTSPYGETDVIDDGTVDVPSDALPDGTADPIPDPTPDGMPDAPYDTIPDPTPDVPPDMYPDLPPDSPPPDVPPDTTTTGNVGDACTSAASCTAVPSPERTCLTDFSGYIELPGGYCTAPCTSDTECGPLGTCVSFYGYGQYCLRDCTVPGDCRLSEGYACQTLPGGLGGPFCIPGFGSPDSSSDY